MSGGADFRRLFDLSDKVAIVTGASGMLGSRLSYALASCGADVVLAGRSVDRLSNAAREIRALGRACLEVRVDVTSETDVADLASKTKDQFGKIDILVAGAGANVLGPSKDYAASDFASLMKINSEGTFLCDREVGKIMLEQKHGKIVNISSVRGWFATSGNTVGYSASKAAVNMITRVLAVEWARYNVNVNAVAPAMIGTGMHTASPSGEVPHLDPKVLEGIERRTPMKRLARADDVCGTVVFLASAASDFITGQVIYVDGGATVWAA